MLQAWNFAHFSECVELCARHKRDGERQRWRDRGAQIGGIYRGTEGGRVCD